MKSAFLSTFLRLTVVGCLLTGTATVAGAQDPAVSPTPLDAKAQERAIREAKKAAEKEAAEARAAAEKERKEAEAAAKKRAKAAASEAKPAELPAASASPSPMDRELEKARKAEEKARLEAEKARKKEEDRVKAEEAKEAERRRKDEERAEREAAKARDKEEKARLEAERKQAQGAAKADKEGDRERDRSEAKAADGERNPEPRGREEGSPKGDDRRRRELVRQIEKARAERDRLNQKAEEAEQAAKAARNAALESQRALEALTTGLDPEDITPTPAPAEPPARKNRFVTKADVVQSASGKDAPKAAADPLRLALDLKKPLPEDRERAAFALASLGPEAQPATRALMAALADTSAAVRTAAAQALGRIGPGASAAVAPLSAALTDPDPAVKNAAQAALIAIQGR